MTALSTPRVGAINVKRIRPSCDFAETKPVDPGELRRQLKVMADLSEGKDPKAPAPKGDVAPLHSIRSCSPLVDTKPVGPGKLRQELTCQPLNLQHHTGGDAPEATRRTGFGDERMLPLKLMMADDVSEPDGHAKSSVALEGEVQERLLERLRCDQQALTTARVKAVDGHWSQPLMIVKKPIYSSRMFRIAAICLIGGIMGVIVQASFKGELTSLLAVVTPGTAASSDEQASAPDIKPAVIKASQEEKDGIAAEPMRTLMVSVPEVMPSETGAPAEVQAAAPLPRSVAMKASRKRVAAKRNQSATRARQHKLFQKLSALAQKVPGKLSRGERSKLKMPKWAMTQASVD